jgi:hypothetical protein
MVWQQLILGMGRVKVNGSFFSSFPMYMETHDFGEFFLEEEGWPV